jgi:hypothetical protein
VKKNITLKLDEDVLRRCRHEAVEQDKSLSQWVADVLSERVRGIERYSEARERAKQRLASGLKLGGGTFNREQSHDRD